MEKLKRSFYEFMQGRYGSRGLDLLSRRLNGLFIVILIVYFILGIAGRENRIFFILALIVLVFMYFRIFSKNYTSRAKENDLYRNIENKILTELIKVKRRIFGTKDHVYTSCPNCKTELRLPRNKGKLKVSCPNCKHIFIKRT